MKTIIFKYRRGWNDVIEEEMEFKDGVTEAEIEGAFADWMISQIVDSCTWYEKEE